MIRKNCTLTYPPGGCNKYKKENELKSAASLILTFSLPILHHYHIHQNAPSIPIESEQVPWYSPIPPPAWKQKENAGLENTATIGKIKVR